MTLQRTAENRLRGFTLIEVLIVVLIIGVLAAIAMPLYLDYTKKTKATEAWEELTHIAALQEQIFTDIRQYDTNGTILPSYGARFVGKYFVISVSDTNIWTATAYLCFRGTGNNDCPQGGYDYLFTINWKGEKTTTPSGGTARDGWSL